MKQLALERGMDGAITMEAQEGLIFKPFTLDEIPRVAAMLTTSPARTCDFTIGGIYMWIDYFRYERAIVDDTLFIKGVSELDVSQTAFSLPVGRMPLHDSIALLQSYCDAHEMPLRLSAVPEEALPSLTALGAKVVANLDDWTDYLYDAHKLASLSGKHLGKKRNHVNTFAAEHPDFRFEALTSANVAAVRHFYEQMHLASDKGVTAEVERLQTLHVLDNLACYPFKGAVLSTPAEGIVAFTLGEVKDDTLYVHIEKMRHDINGAGETINKLFASYMTEHYALNYINREEDAGDDGLRQAKLSYHPAQLLRKYDVVL